MSDARRPGWWRPVDDWQVCMLALVTVLGVWSVGRWWLLAMAAGSLVAVLRQVGVPLRRDLVVAAFVLLSVGGAVSARSWAAAVPRTLGSFQGWATLESDPESFGVGVRAVLDIEGQRFDATVYGAGRRRLQARQAGERIEVQGVRQLGKAPWARRAQVRHVVGDLTVQRVGAWSEGTELSMASNRLRIALRTSADGSMSDDQAALFTGLVIGDDTRQPDTMIDDFRMSGLSHLTAVSGQNVAFVLAVVGVGLRRLPRWSRLAATVGVIAWFVVLTRVEPSVLRAGTMAALSAVAFALGRERTATRTLGLALIMLVLIDPLLVWSVGFWLSVGATFGVSAIAPLVESRLHGPAWLTAPLSITIGAQIGVLLPSWLVFHRMPVVGIGANLLAVPIAGFVMLYGIPAGLLAALTPSIFDGLVMWPATVGTRWVSTVASLAARAEPHGLVAVLCWALQLAALAAVWQRPVQLVVDERS
ncbi:MAG: comEC [Ilumatobacteraceae bacterium]|nr:comEC [Ilumatobacteraceae bacterium]